MSGQNRAEKHGFVDSQQHFDTVGDNRYVECQSLPTFPMIVLSLNSQVRSLLRLHEFKDEVSIGMRLIG